MLVIKRNEFEKYKKIGNINWYSKILIIIKYCYNFFLKLKICFIGKFYFDFIFFYFSKVNFFFYYLKV